MASCSDPKIEAKPYVSIECGAPARVSAVVLHRHVGIPVARCQVEHDCDSQELQTTTAPSSRKEASEGARLLQSLVSGAGS